VIGVLTALFGLIAVIPGIVPEAKNFTAILIYIILFGCLVFDIVVAWETGDVDSQIVTPFMMLLLIGWFVGFSATRITNSPVPVQAVNDAAKLVVNSLPHPVVWNVVCAFLFISYQILWNMVGTYIFRDEIEEWEQWETFFGFLVFMTLILAFLFPQA
jgi:hypothetical protein